MRRGTRETWRWEFPADQAITVEEAPRILAELSARDLSGSLVTYEGVTYRLERVGADDAQ